MDSMLGKGALEVGENHGAGYYSLLFLVQKVPGRWREIIDLWNLKQLHHPHEIQDGYSIFGPKSHRNGDGLFLDLKDA